MKALLIPAALLLTAQTAPPAAKAPPAPPEIVAAAPAKDWVTIAPADLLVMDLAPDAAGRSTRSGPRRVVIQLIPPPFSQGWVGNIRKLAAAHWWDGTSVNRVQDNYVTQWGDASEKKPLPAGLAAMQEGAYALTAEAAVYGRARSRLLRQARPDFRPARGEHGRGYWHTARDPYTNGGSAFDGGWALGYDGNHIWPVHCYGMVGVGRNLSPDTGTGAELYTVIGHAPRHLDRNIALVGRVIAGMEHLSSLPRGTEALGFYKTAAERTPIRSVRLASDLPTAQRPRFEYLSTESESFARYAEARANRRDAFFIRPAGGADICNVPVPVRAKG